MINISFETKSPLCQIDKTENASSIKNAMIKVKRQKTFVENRYGVKKPLQVPIYTGNGYRGMLRRETMAVMLEAYAKKAKEGENIIATPEDYHLMNAGGGSMYQEQPFDVVDEVRKLNPQLSLFGASLAIEGKLKISNFVPFKENEDGEKYYQFFETENGNLYSSILSDTTIVTKDGILDRDKNSQFLTREQIEEWYEKSDANIRARKLARDNDTATSNNKKVKKISMRGAIDREYVAVGVNFFGSISTKENLTDIEKGLLIKGLEKAILNNLGATSANDFGKVEYHIRLDDKSIIETSVDKYGKCIISNRKYSEDIELCVKAVEDFLDNISKENFEISKILE